MIWTALFSISIAQGIFLISSIIIRGSKNPLASRLIIALLVIMIFTNFGYLVARTGLVNYLPQFFAIPFGMMLLFGPLFYFYAQSVIDPSFRWKKKYWLHFIPYVVQVLVNMPLFFIGKEAWNGFIGAFLSGGLPVRLAEKIILALQDVHLLVYILVTRKWISKAGAGTGNGSFLISISARVRWVTQLGACFLFFLLTVVVLYVFTVIHGNYHPIANYTYTLVSSVIIYFVAYKLMLDPEPVSPGFAQKYKTYMQFAGQEGEEYLRRLKELMEEQKIFTNAELKLAMVAEEMKLPAHQLSKLINEKFGRSFTDYINEYRVGEFISRMSDPAFRDYSIYGIALDAGFNSKSAFNTSFRKITGKTPSEYKRSLPPRPNGPDIQE